MGLFRRPTPMDPAEIERLKRELSALREAIEQHQTTARMLHDRLTTLDDRVTSVSTELANQLTELGKDIDALGDLPTPDGVDPEVLDTLRQGQFKLANEQARYQIAFREDLARLAQDLKRQR